MAGRWRPRGGAWGRIGGGALALAAVGWLGPVATPAWAASGNITVTVVRDAFFDGVYHAAGDAGVAGIPVTFTDGSGHRVSVSTDATGVARLDLGTAPLAGGAYRVEATIPASMGDLRPAVVGTGATAFAPLVSFVDVAAGADVALTMGVAGPAAAGRAGGAPTQIGDRVWLDTDGDGVQDPGEPPLAGVTCALSDDGGPVGAPAVTDQAGYYRFDGVRPDTSYTITCDKTTATGLPAGTRPADLTVTAKGVGADPELDSNAAPDQTIAVLTGGPGDTDQGYDLGYTLPAAPAFSIGDKVFLDANGDGIQDAGDTGIGHVAVTVTDFQAGLAGSATTADDGTYRITTLAPGTPYSICFDPAAATGLPVGATGGDLRPTTPMVGADPAVDSNIDSTDCASFTSPASGADPTIDAGFTVPTAPPTLPAPATVEVGDQVTFDANGDGLQDAGDRPLGHVGVTLADDQGDRLGSTTTDAAGRYRFADLTPATHMTMCFDPSSATGLPDGVAPNRLTPTAKGIGRDETLDSDIDGTGCFGFTTPETGVALIFDAGYKIVGIR